ncbi:MAG: hypothetical protein COX78_04335 [Candidatus Levybacteria bacterium CG_4_10_14_0_2_um_filter_35_8]|nr:MAG: hypothetical protein COW87_00395 [Candidatus Levybacteria bacterium CG22_combo_CG10-13_8_21_14_all_35_11]PIZ97691.1 MAG: hypothetical protein COX78_04335 [Candidatus Levybacteria bacterium CG_4_10_14_0_2_um_filter_35_8]
MSVIVLNKPIGKTPLQTIEEYRLVHPELTCVKLAYAGRLDPMAEGLLLVLVGEECKKKKDYENLSKIYEFEVLFGISTDTFDVMGKITKINPQPVEISAEEIHKVIKKYKGEILQEYPPYSSLRVNGKPLFWWARENRLDEIKIPSKRIMIYDLSRLNRDSKLISSRELLETVHERIEKVKGDFRQKEILQIWDKKLKDKNLKFSVLSFKIICSSGTYVRSIANSIGEDLKVGAIAFAIKRSRIGSYKF